MDDKRLFVDIDGTLAVFNKVDTLETLYEQGYFLNLDPQINVVDSIKLIIREHQDIEVFIMSSVLSDSAYALDEKNQWLDKYLPDIDAQHRIFPPCGKDKKDYIPGGVRETDHLLDDYTHNLSLWEPPAKGIKLLNGINNTRGTWKQSKLDYRKSAEELARNIVDIIENGAVIKDSIEAGDKTVESRAERMSWDEKESFIEGIEITVDYSYGHTIPAAEFELYDFLTKERSYRDMIRESGNLLDNVPDNFKTKAICFEAVQKDGRALEYVPEKIKTEDICTAAVIQDYSSIEFVPEELKMSVFNKGCDYIHSDNSKPKSVREKLNEINNRNKDNSSKGKNKEVPEI